MRNKPNYNPMQYSVDWANVMTSYLKKQLAEIALPIAPRLGVNIKQTFKGVLTDPDTRDRWVSKFIYSSVTCLFLSVVIANISPPDSLELLRIFYSEFMVDHATFLSWLVQQLGSCNLAQAGFVARLADDYLDGIVTRRALAKPLIDGCLLKLQDVGRLLYTFWDRSDRLLEDLDKRVEGSAGTFARETRKHPHSKCFECFFDSEWIRIGHRRLSLLRLIPS